MANTSSAKKAIRVSARKKSVNNKIKTDFRDAKKEVMKAVVGNKPAKAKKLLSDAYSKIDFAAKKGTIHKNTANRYKSRLAGQISKISKK